ncbi:MAG: DUF6279 family lipoprotein [Polaromonas sp.]|uniref:DUF6279 family lipoprotein n=1 Tax=Polaromonas sp. TaxID=1869339 RepID=UPI003263F2A0
MLAAMLLGALLPACTVMMKLAYNQASELVYWHLDGHFDFTDIQGVQVRAELGKLHAWHRQTQLPGYIDTLQKLQQQMPQDMDTAKACAVYADLRRKLQVVAEQAGPMTARLAGTLHASQMKKLQQRFDKGNADYREDFLESAKTSRKKRYKEAVNRAEMLYGRLDEKQLDIIGRRIDMSHFDASVSYRERLRRQQDALQTLRPLTGGQSTPDKTHTAVKGLFERTLSSPDTAYRDYLESLSQDICQGFAELHNSTTPAQRGKAVEVLHRYERDFRTLNGQKA